MKQVVLDTETTGISPKAGHRIIEIGCVELVDRQLTGRRFQQYCHPEREIDEGAQRVHGITLEFLSDKPRFSEIHDAFMQFIEGAELIIHNAPFDLGFLDAELARVGAKLTCLEDRHSIIDTLVMARAKHPGQKNNLDALCKRYNVDNTSRDLHGALLDSEILAAVYLAMTGGQTKFSFESAQTRVDRSSAQNPAPKMNGGFLLAATADEQKAHAAYLEVMEKNFKVEPLFKQD